MITGAQQIDRRDGFINVREWSSDEEQVVSAEAVYQDQLSVRTVNRVQGWQSPAGAIFTHVGELDGSHYLLQDFALAACERVDGTPALSEHADFILAHRPAGHAHLLWVATAPVKEIVDWAIGEQR